ncbi:MAG: serine hydrolase [Deltaproteobacteria bacterium]|jgi:CubicO group peptidase (beta-lactamase class C family)|nr:serine hydrolase [Deltaproteobacteria bacterium]
MKHFIALVQRYSAGIPGIAIIGLLMTVLVACQTTPHWAPYEGSNQDSYPGEHWQKVQTPEQLGWSSEKLAVAREYSKTIDTAAVMIVDNGVVVDAWGDITKNFQCHSMRKSIMSALIGVHVDQGNLDLLKTMAELNIDDYEPALTLEEKKATMGDLIKARSGVYHPALGEDAIMKAMRPRRHSHPAGTFWYYNNWDFNALGTIFEQETGTKIFEEFERRFAKPLQMEDFKVSRCRYLDGDAYGDSLISRHRYYLFRVSARDLARFGLLFLREGRWQKRQIVSSAWVRQSTATHSEIRPDSGYGYMWWTGTREGFYPNVKVKGHSYRASGWGGHKIFVLPYRNLVIVHRVNTDWKGETVSSGQMGRLLWHILDAAGETDIGEKPVLEGAEGILLTGENLHETLAGGVIQTDNFLAKFMPDNRIELWMGRKRIDTGKWWGEGDKCRLKTRVFTGGRTVGISLVLDGDTIKWYDGDGTREGKGIYANINGKKVDENKTGSTP